MNSFAIVEIFETDDEHRRGLQFCTIEKDECGVFLYKAKCRPSFWNINVPTDLWVTPVVDGITCAGFKMIAGSTDVHKIDCLTNFVIESRVKIRRGAFVDIDEKTGRLFIA